MPSPIHHFVPPFEPWHRPADHLLLRSTSSSISSRTPRGHDARDARVARSALANGSSLPPRSRRVAKMIVVGRHLFTASCRLPPGRDELRDMAGWPEQCGRRWKDRSSFAAARIPRCACCVIDSLDLVRTRRSSIFPGCDPKSPRAAPPVCSSCVARLCRSRGRDAHLRLGRTQATSRKRACARAERCLVGFHVSFIRVRNSRAIPFRAWRFPRTSRRFSSAFPRGHLRWTHAAVLPDDDTTDPVANVTLRLINP